MKGVTTKRGKNYKKNDNDWKEKLSGLHKFCVAHLSFWFGMGISN